MLIPASGTVPTANTTSRAATLKSAKTMRGAYAGTKIVSERRTKRLRITTGALLDVTEAHIRNICIDLYKLGLARKLKLFR